MPRSVVLAVDGSQYAEHAFKWYLDNKQDNNDHIHLVTVTDLNQVHLPISWYGPQVGLLSDAWKDSLLNNYDESRETLQRYSDQLTKAGICLTKHHRTTSGGPGWEICDVAREVAADTIIMGCRGLGTFSRALLGSTSDYVLHHSNCPVTIVKHKKEMNAMFGERRRRKERFTEE